LNLSSDSSRDKLRAGFFWCDRSKLLVVANFTNNMERHDTAIDGISRDEGREPKEHFHEPLAVDCHHVAALAQAAFAQDNKAISNSPSGATNSSQDCFKAA